MMERRVVITTLGSYGDLHPFIAVALQLKEKGFTPIIATRETYREKVEREGLDFRPVRPTLDQVGHDMGLSESELRRQLVERHGVYLIETLITPYLRQSFDDLVEVMNGAEFVITSSLSIAGRLAAEKLKIPLVSVLLSPMLFFSVDDPPCFIESSWLPLIRAKLGRGVTKFFLDASRMRLRYKLRKVDKFRQDAGLPPTNEDELMDGPLHGKLIAGLYSPVLAPLPPDAPPQSFIAGFTFYDRDGDGAAALSQSLQEFLENGPPPIVFTLGSFAVHDPAGFYEDSAIAARKTGRRAVLLVAPDKEEEMAARLASSDVYVAGYVPHSLIFPRAAAIVHHGGIGTSAQALRAGRPQLVTPALGDQADNAERLARLGVAKRLDHKRYSANRAAKLLSELTREGGPLATKAASLAEQIGREDGAAAIASKIAALPHMLGAPSALKKESWQKT
jgi:rhamnosyltransferase subunit B